MGKLGIIARAGTMLAALSVLVVAVTFAALSSTATLTNNTISSATADLLISSDGTPTTNSDDGFTITNLVPGGAASGPHEFTLLNNGSVDMGVTVYATPSAVTGALDNTKLHFCFTRVTGGPSTTCYTYAQMLALFNTVPGGPLTVGSGEVDYELNVNMDADAITGEGASVASFDLVFTGTQQ